MSLHWKHVEFLLKVWGRWVSQHGEFYGGGDWPPQSPIVGMWNTDPPTPIERLRNLTARGTPTKIFGGHRILEGYTTPDYVLRVNVAVSVLPEGQYMAVCCRYALGVDHEGKELRAEIIAAILDIELGAYEERLRRARTKLGRLLCKSTGKCVDSAHCQSLAS